jgi:adenylate kinase
VNAILLGPQGVGKGTQGQIVAPQLKLARIATGDLLRAAVRQGNELGKLAQGYLDRGELVPDDVVIGLVMEKLQQVEQAEPPLIGALFDGFPRTLPQAEGLDAALAGVNERIDVVVNIDAPRPVLLERLTGRITCAVCETVYNLRTRPPKVPGVCDVCGSTELRQRADDTEEAITRRLDLYERETAPLMAWFQERDLLVQVDGEGDLDTVTDRLVREIDRRREL